jgi:hypothetical protein
LHFKYLHSQFLKPIAAIRWQCENKEVELQLLQGVHLLIFWLPDLAAQRSACGCHHAIHQHSALVLALASARSALLHLNNKMDNKAKPTVKLPV